MQLFAPVQLEFLLPELVLVGGAILVLLCVFLKREAPDLAFYICGLTISLSGISLFLSGGFQVAGVEGAELLSGDTLSMYARAIFLLSSLLVAILSRPYVEKAGIPSPEYYSLILFATSGMNLLAAGSDFVVIFLGLELLSVSLWALTAIDKRNARGNEAALKFFLLSAFASAFFLYGAAFAFGASGTFSLGAIRSAAFAGKFGGTIASLSFGLILVGLGFKVGMVPFHMWIPDVYEGAPTPVTAFLSAGPKVAGFAALVRIFLWMFPDIPYSWMAVFAFFAVITMILGNILAVAQEDIKRMLAYSSIAHAGYLLVGIVSLGKGDTSPLLFYFLVYSVMSIGAFSIVSSLEKKESASNPLTGFSGLSRTNPRIAFSMAILMIAMAGIPPTAGFAGKFYIFSAAVRSGYTWLAIVGVLNSVVSAFYYLRVIVFMYMKEPVPGAESVRMDAHTATVILITLILTIMLGLFPRIGSEQLLYGTSQVAGLLR